MKRYINVIWNFWFFITRGFLQSIAELRVQEKIASAAGLKLHVIIMIGGIGDIVAADPAIRHLAQPGERVVMLARPGYLGMFAFNQVVACGIRVDSYVQALLLRKKFGRARWTNLQVDGQRCNMFRIKLSNKNSAGISSANYYENRTLADVYALVGTGRLLADHPRVYEDQNFDAAAFLEDAFGSVRLPILVVHAQATEAVRSWSPQACRDVIKLILSRQDLNVIEVGLAPVLEAGVHIRCLGSELSLPQQMALLREATGFVGVDSGFAHIANALSVPSIYLLGTYSHFSKYQPWRLGEYDILLRTDEKSPSGVATHRVVAAIETLLSRD